MGDSETYMGGAYPLSNRQGRRRRMLCLNAKSPRSDLPSPSETVIPPQNSIAKVSTPRDEEVRESVVTLDHDGRTAPWPGLEGIWQLLDGVQPVTWVFTGDGVTHGARHTSGARCFPELFAERIRWELRRLLDVVINTGVEGAKCNNLQSDLEWRVTRFEPDVVFVTMGLHDSIAGARGALEFRRHLAEVVDELEADGAIVVLNTPNPVLPQEDERFAHLPQYVEQIRSISDELQIPLVDHWAHWERVCPGDAALAQWLGRDGIHPNGQGHRQMARLVLHRLGLFDRQSPTCHVPAVPI